MNFNPEERNFYEDHLKWMMIEASTLKKAEEKAEARGEARGKAELIKMMIDQNNSMDAISKITGLSIVEIKKLIESLEK